MRLIDADKLKRTFQKYGSSEDVDIIINCAKTVDPVKHSRWATSQSGLARTCKNCDFIRAAADLAWSYCPNCGAKMDL